MPAHIPAFYCQRATEYASVQSTVFFFFPLPKRLWARFWQFVHYPDEIIQKMTELENIKASVASQDVCHKQGLLDSCSCSLCHALLCDFKCRSTLFISYAASGKKHTLLATITAAQVSESRLPSFCSSFLLLAKTLDPWQPTCSSIFAVSSLQ